MKVLLLIEEFWERQKKPLYCYILLHLEITDPKGESLEKEAWLQTDFNILHARLLRELCPLVQHQKMNVVKSVHKRCLV